MTRDASRITEQVPDRLGRVQALAAFFDHLDAERERYVRASIEDTAMTSDYAERELNAARRVGQQFLGVYENAAPAEPSGGMFAINLPYNSTLMALVLSMTRAYLAGHGVLVRTSSKLSGLASLLGAGMAAHLPGVELVATPGEQFLKEAFERPGIFGAMHYGAYSRLVDDLMATARRTRRAFIFEGPGNNPWIIADRTELEMRVKSGFRAACANSGQICMSPKRIYAVRSVADDVRRFLAEEAAYIDEQLTGDPYQRNLVGPVGDERLVTDPRWGFSELIAEALGHPGSRSIYSSPLGVASRITICTGTGERQERWIVRPTVIEVPDENARLARNEKFGPVFTFAEVEDVDEAVARANDSEYGLIATALVAEEAAASVRAALGQRHGRVVINEHFLSQGDTASLFTGGYRRSGRFGYPTASGYAAGDGPVDRWELFRSLQFCISFPPGKDRPHEP